jgi:hypothetical protein
MTTLHPTQRQPRQLALPLHPPPRVPLADDGVLIAPQVLWTMLLPAERDRVRQQILAVLQEVVHERASS